MRKYKKIFALALPLMLGMVLQSLQGTADMMFVSWLGTDSVAAVILGNNIFGTFLMFTALVTSGAIALLARSYGEKDHESIKKISGEAIGLSIIIGGIIGALTAGNAFDILKFLFNASDSTTMLSSKYSQIILGAVVVVFLNSTFRTILQAHGDTKSPLYIFGLGNIINVILDPLFIFTFDMGVEGAAWATVASRIVCLVLIFMVVVKKVYGGNYGEFLHHLRLKIEDSIRILKIGSLACVQSIARPITGMMMFRLVTKVGGDVGTAAFGIGGQLFNYTFIVLTGLSMSISIMVGHKIGENKIEETDEIIKSGMELGFINMVLFLIPYILLPEFIFGLFKSEPDVIATGVQYLRIVYIGVFFVVYPMIYGGVFRGAGDTLPPMLTSLFANVIVKLFFAYLLSDWLGYGVVGVWIAISISVIVEAALITVFYRKGSWKTKVI